MHGIMQHTTRLMNLVLGMAVLTGCASIQQQSSQPPTKQEVSKTQQTIANTIEAIILKGLMK